ncbi:hypothetical protein [Fischerella thermalis]|uniref:hypothetical protein n=1 Tax=Fischerella thermalis TaxID=372787 RepID=UPI0015E0677F|nr:hypothetical protein [Fischerella thermalis]
MKSRVQRGRQKFKELLQTCSQLQMDAVDNVIEYEMVDNVIEYEMKDVQICRSCGLAK